MELVCGVRPGGLSLRCSVEIQVEMLSGQLGTESETQETGLRWRCK